MTLRPPTSKRLRDAAEELLRHPDVVGVLWGERSRRGRWTGESCVSIHVHRKLSKQEVGADRRLPSKLCGHRVDIIEVGRPVAHWLGHTDEVTAKGHSGPRRSTATLYFADDKDRVHGLFSGHGVLPLRGRTLTRAYDSRRQPKARFEVVDERVGRYAGQLVRGRCQGAADWALASFPQSSLDTVDAHHLAAGTPPPIARRKRRLSQGDELWHYSRVRGRHKRMGGVVRHVALAGVTVLLPDGSNNCYTQVICVSGRDGREFSVPGDSGSLVVDRSRKAVGTVVGGSADGRLSYVLSLDGVERTLGGHYADAFR